MIFITCPGAKRAASIAESFAAQKETRMVMLELQKYGISQQLAVKIYNTFQADTLAVVRSNPYLLAERIKGVGFQTADGIALSMGIAPDSFDRLRAGILYALNEAAGGDGHTYLPKEELLARARGILRVDAALLDGAIRDMLLRADITVRVFDDVEAIYLYSVYLAEVDVAKRLSFFRRTFLEDDAAKNADARIAEYERHTGVTLGEGQREAVRLSVSGPLTIITGGPGTGKTTGIRCIVSLLQEGGKVALCAPTGRAAKRMSEATGCEAKTIHRLLKYGGEGDGEGFTVDENDPLDADTVIVDEVSMIDIFLMRALLRAIKPGSRLIMVGDADQLPSVGAGNVLHDLCACGEIPVVRLREIFRQAQESMIVVNAHKINSGELPVCNGKDSDFFLVRADTARSIQESVLSLVSTRLPNYMGIERDGVQVIAPMKKGEAGVLRLNLLLQEALNPPSEEKNEIARGGDKVMQTRNNYDIEWFRDGEEGKGVFNGDLGIVTDADAEERELTVAFDDGRVMEYGKDDLSDLELAYALTIHKSQGSEFSCVVMPLLRGPDMLMTRNLFYTAVTRAKQLVVLVGREDCIRQMVGNDHIANRYSGLEVHLREMFRL